MRFKTKFLKSDYKKRYLIKKEENKIIINSSLFKNLILPLSIREEVFKTSLNMKRTQVRNRCILTGRPRGILSNFGVSRLIFRKEAEKGNIPGITSHE
jgi:ribosomal protein S14